MAVGCLHPDYLHVHVQISWSSSSGIKNALTCDALMAFSVLHVVRHKQNAHFKRMYQSAETSLLERAKSSIGSHQDDSCEGVTLLVRVPLE